MKRFVRYPTLPMILPTVVLGLFFAQVAPASAAGANEFKANIRPFLDQHCFGCHDADTQRGGLLLDGLAPDFADKETAKKWVGVLDRMEAGEMPPKKTRRPPQAEMRAVTDWLRSGLHAADVARQKAEGRTVYRRLNRVEYENTVRDLLAVEVRLQELLPEDMSAHGFDNIAEALTVSSVLMERYLEAADAALDVALVNGPQPRRQRWWVSMVPHFTRPDDYRLKSGVRVLPDNTLVLFNSGFTPITLERFRAPVAGRYHFRLAASAFQSAGQPLTLAVYAGSFDPRLPKRRVVGHYDLPPDQETVIEFTETLMVNGTLKTVPHRLGQHNIPDGAAYTGPGVAVHWVEVEGPLHDTWPPVSHRRLLGDTDLKTGNLADAERILAAFVPRAFRRPVSRAEVEPFVALVKARLEQQYPFEEALRVGLKAVLCAPEFLFLVEKKPGRLDGYAVASRLSYFLWSSMPDEALLDLAAKGTLTRPAVLHDQVERLLRDPKARAFTENFTGQWLDLRHIDFTLPDRKLYPEFDELLQVSMVKETQLFFDEILNHDLSVRNFIDSDFTMLNERLANHYGIAGVKGQEFRKVPLPPGSHRGGVLTQASVLKVTANGTTTSPVPRGKWVLERIIGRPVPPPPKDVPAIEPDIRGARTIREQLAKHRDLKQCMVCHAKLDPPGFALENFDVIGGWRENYRSLGEGQKVNAEVDGRKVQYRRGPKVDASAELPDGREFSGIDEFKRLLLEDRDQVARCDTEKLLVYATGHGLEFADRAVVNDIVQRARAKDHGLRTLVHEVVQSPTFLSK